MQSISMSLKRIPTRVHHSPPRCNNSTGASATKRRQGCSISTSPASRRCTAITLAKSSDSRFASLSD
eukprot:5125383-Pleurochrysis_carterae.AAC.2